MYIFPFFFSLLLTTGARRTKTFEHGVNSSSLVIRWLVLGIGMAPGGWQGRHGPSPLDWIST